MGKICTSLVYTDTTEPKLGAQTTSQFVPDYIQVEKNNSKLSSLIAIYGISNPVLKINPT